MVTPPPTLRLCECTEAEAEIVLQLKNELREKELKLTDIRLEALSSAHHLDQIREAMNRMQVMSHPPSQPPFGPRLLMFGQRRLSVSDAHFQLNSAIMLISRDYL